MKITDILIALIIIGILSGLGIIALRQIDTEDPVIESTDDQPVVPEGEGTVPAVPEGVEADVEPGPDEIVDTPSTQTEAEPLLEQTDPAGDEGVVTDQSAQEISGEGPVEDAVGETLEDPVEALEDRTGEVVEDVSDAMKSLEEDPLAPADATENGEGTSDAGGETETPSSNAGTGDLSGEDELSSDQEPPADAAE